jgi:hypothetical protein
MEMSMTDLRYVLPDRFSAEHVESTCGKTIVCPFCRSQSTESKGKEDTTWVETPLRTSSPKWICLGCCIDIYSTSLDDDFDENPFNDIVCEVAKRENLGIDEARSICLKHQSELADRKYKETGDARYRGVIDKIINIKTTR